MSSNEKQTNLTEQESQSIQAQHDPSREPPSEQPIQRVTTTGEDYSILTVTQKKLIIMVASVASLFSPMATAIYYPSLDTISKDLNVTNSKINITVTIFLVIQGIAPSFVADIADRQGRRPMYIYCFIVFTAANIGLALQNNYVALLILRMIQAAGSSGTVALANGVVGDIVTSAERGTYIAYASLGGIMGPMIAPILGGVIGEYAGWHWIFWFLIIFSCAVFIPLILFMPETCRNVVDNGSIPPPFFSRNITDTIRHRHRREKGLEINEEKQAEFASKYKFRLPNPISTLRVLLDPESAVLLIATGLGLGCFYAISTGASVAFSQNYGFSQVKIGLMFIPIGAGSVLSAFTSGRLVDWNYRRWCARLNVPVIKNRRQDLTNFPIERARLEVAFPVFFVGGAFLVAYGWILTAKVSVAVPVVFLFFTGYALTSCFQILNVLMVDIYPGKPSVATAANNFVRCEIGAVFSAVLLPLVDRVGWGWAYTILALLFIGFAPMLLLIMNRGPKWRKARKEREDRARAHRQEKRELKIEAAAKGKS
ncbi:MFS general substrate transporter [Mollisia scopiformis]|uniref:MFS general substrate transporter n=1 Tax=Mollisia scopiformis TaxID=149040 RepID=A0A194X265_MOLSC|nr:MFS general substrate transporter [Mollisia scopiformis]KUJ14094.1 MFS general substrate transporter [Mollisia scopiformis]